MEELLARIRQLHTKELIQANILECTAGTTGYCGGDTGHGGRTYLSLKDLSSTDMRVRIKIEENTVFESDLMGGEIEIGFGGDCELSTFAQALEFALKVYEEDIRKRR